MNIELEDTTHLKNDRAKESANAETDIFTYGVELPDTSLPQNMRRFISATFSSSRVVYNYIDAKLGKNARKTRRM